MLGLLGMNSKISDDVILAHWVGLSPLCFLKKRGVATYVVLLVLLVFFCLPAIASARSIRSVPLTETSARLTADWPAWRWTTLAGDDALVSGLPALAEALYRRVLSEDIPEEARRLVYLKLISALIAEGDFEQARDYLQLLKPLEGQSAYHLRVAILAYEADDFEQCSSQLQYIDEAQLSRAERPWYFLLEGLAQRENGDFDKSTAYIELAIENSVSSAQAAQFESIIMLNRIENEPVSQALADLLRRKVEENRGSDAGFEFARELAIVLNNLGEKKEALNLLQEQLGMLTQSEWQRRERLLLLIGLVAGERSKRSSIAYAELLRQRGTEENQRIALYHLLQSAQEDELREAFMKLLGDIIQEREHSVRDEALLLAARMAIEQGQYPQADETLDLLLADYPGSPLADEALWLKAQLAWDMQRYRTAANVLEQLQARGYQQRSGIELNRLIADCYYINGDYGLAADVYRNELEDISDVELRKLLAYRLILAEIEAGDYPQAAKDMDYYRFYGWLELEDVWKSEYNLIYALRREQRYDDAFRRLNYRLYNLDDTHLPAPLRVRLLWLAATLAYETDKPNVANAYIDQAIETLGGVKPEDMSEQERALLMSSLRLQQGKGELLAGDEPAGLATLEQLREQFPSSEAAISSYLIGARYHAEQFQIVEAQRLLRELAARHSDSEQAPYALFEASILAEKLGQERNYIQASDILRELLERYPEHPIVFQAKLSLGNIARRLNQFEAAQVIYDNILQEYRQQGEAYPLYLAELYRADSILAQSGLDWVHLDSAEGAFEHLLDRDAVPVDVRAEAGYKLALVRIKKKHEAHAVETLWFMNSRFLADPDIAGKLGGNGRYWMSRSVLELGKQLEKTGQSDDAIEVYQMIDAYGLPGQSIAQARIANIVQK